MQRAYVLINVESGSEDIVAKKIKSVADAEETYISYGVYDLIVKVKSNTMDELKNTVTNKIRTLDHVKSTLTLILT